MKNIIELRLYNETLMTDLRPATGREAEPGKFVDIHVPTLLAYLPPPEKRNGISVVICPGGGYGMVSCINEGYPVAEWLHDLGYCAYILKYRLPSTQDVDVRHLIPLADIQQGLRMARGFAARDGLRVDRVGVLGFSAGGHLAASAMTRYKHPVVKHAVSCRPDFAVLVYPVISFVDDCAHAGSRDNLLPHEPSPEILRRLSPELNVTDDAPPVFLAHAKDDPAVPYHNSVLFYEACQRVGVEAELRLYESGGHGFGLGLPPRDSSQWPQHAAKWLTRSLAAVSRNDL